jgi:DNA-binding LacI/PurR family transcriptional regulator
MKVRLADIAGRAGVSEATVSRVLNGKPGVAQATRESVLAALDVLGYERPLHLGHRTTGLVGLIVPELDNPVFPMFAQAVEIDLIRNGYAPVLCTLTAGGVHEDDYVELLQERKVAGILFVSGIHAIADTSPTRYTRLRDQGLPIVLVNGYLQGVDAPFISNDDAASVDLAVSHLADLGHRRIGLAMGPPRYTPSIRKISGFHSAMRRHLGGEVDPNEVDHLVETTSFRLDGGALAAGALLDRGVTAIVCGSDLMALGAVRTVRARGLRVPQDVSVVGSDDSSLIEFTDPPLTTIRQPVAAMGAAAVQALVHEIQGIPAPRAEYLFRPELVVRGSTAKAPARRPARRRAAEAVQA